MDIKIALAGNPNCGKTTLFNALTGSNQFVGNWPGVTVEKKEGRLKGQKNVTIMDLPGIYSLSPYTLEEVVARNYLVNERPDVILNIVDGTNIERNLYLTTQLTELGIPVVMAVNMMDIVEKNGDKIDFGKLEKELGVTVRSISALKGTGINEAANTAVRIATSGKKTIPMHKFAGGVEHALAHIEEAALHSLPEEQQRWYAIKIFERDPKVLEQLKIPQDTLKHIEADIEACEIELDDDAESIITASRYDWISKIIKSIYIKKSKSKLSASDKIDRIVTNRILALPIFALVMIAIYYISITAVGGPATDWTNDVLVGAMIVEPLRAFLEGINTAPWLLGLVVDGIVSGVGSVIGFVPQMLVLFLLLCILEDCGYMARIAFIMDRIFRRFGLSGKSFIPMLVGTGCGVPGIMASRTIEQDRDRKMTIMTTTFIPCGAKMPIVGLMAGAIFGGAWWVAPSAYFIGVGAIVVSGIILKKTKPFAGEPAPFVMELPAYHMPTAANVLRGTWERGWSFIKKAGTIITLASIFVWFTSSYGFTEAGFGAVEMDSSIMAQIGSALSVIFRPLGFGTWQASAATVLGLVAKEEVVGTFGTLFAVAGDALEMVENGEFAGLAPIASQFTQLSAYSFLVFNLLCAPCFAAIGAIKREMNNSKWTWAAIGYQCALAYAVSLIVYQLGGVITGTLSFGAGTVAAAIVLVFMLYMLFRKGYVCKENNVLRAVDAAQ
ncbi:Fe(2+) transporter FeoB [Clostridiales bacterium]|nr:Fe(2+) transporter FeoB [Clostridiales bacterium]